MDTEQGRTIVYLRFPFKRDGFVDPPTAVWDETKERQLWQALTRHDDLTNYKSVDWQKLLEQFGVPIGFLQQHAFWLYQHHLHQLQQQKNTKAQGKRPQQQLPESEKKQWEADNFDFNRLFKPEFHTSLSSSFGQNVGSPGGNNVTVSPNSGARNELSATDSSSFSAGSNPVEHDREEHSQIDEITAHLHTSRIFLARPPTFDDDDDDEDDDDQVIVGDADKKEKEEGGAGDGSKKPESATADQREPVEGRFASGGGRVPSGTSRSPLIDQIKFLAKKYR